MKHHECSRQIVKPISTWDTIINKITITILSMDTMLHMSVSWSVPVMRELCLQTGAGPAPLRPAVEPRDGKL